MSDNEAGVPARGEERGEVGAGDVVAVWNEQAGEAHAQIERMYEAALAQINGIHEASWSAILRPPTSYGYPATYGRHDPAHVRRPTAGDSGDERDSTVPGVDTLG